MFLLLSLPAMPSISPSCGSFPRDDAVYAPPPPPYNFGILPRSSETTIICAAALRGSSRERENCAAHTYFSMQSSFASAAAERSAIIESKHAKQGGHARRLFANFRSLRSDFFHKNLLCLYCISSHLHCAPSPSLLPTPKCLTGRPLPSM